MESLEFESYEVSVELLLDRFGAGEVLAGQPRVLVRLENPDCPVFPEMYLPEIAMSSYLASVPVLKAHSLADLTGSLKNMRFFRVSCG